MNSIINFMNAPYYWLLLGIVLLLEIYLNSKVNIIVGKAGEYYAKQELKKLSKDKYTVINDLMIEVDSRTHQIDHIVVSNYGIFVIETKQYNGYISGSKYDKKWVRKGKKNDIYYTNPVRQNYGHIKAICDLLKLDESVVYNVVYIPSPAKLHIKHDGEVVLADQLCKKILSYSDLKLYNKDEIATMLREKI